MKFKELLSITENKKNKQINLSVRKKELKKVGLSIQDLLNIKLNKLYNQKGGKK